MDNEQYIRNHWKYADEQLARLHTCVIEEQAPLSDEIQSILNHFSQMGTTGYLPKTEVLRLHRFIEKWRRQGYDVGEMRWLMQDLKNRNRIKRNEGLLAFLLAALLANYQTIIKLDISIMEKVVKQIYRVKFDEAQQTTDKGVPKAPNKKFIESVLSQPLPNGGDYYSDLYADARYRAGQLAKNAVSYIAQNKLPDIHNTEFEKIMQAQRNWQLRRTAVTSGGGFAGYYDMIMSFMVGHTVVKAFIDAGVEEYEFVATIDDRTTKECRELNGKTFKMSELKLGINAPPVYPPPHPCRSVMRVIK